MSTEASTIDHQSARSPTSVRYLVLSVTTLMSVLLYLDRYAPSIALKLIGKDLQVTKTQVAWFVSAFFWSYALCQVPAGWLTDHFGARRMLTIYILAWSVFTGLMGPAHVIWLMIVLRLFCGAAQAGAYPTSASVIRQWYPISFRGTASAIVGLGGRFGAVLAPIWTAWMIEGFSNLGLQKEAAWRPVIVIYGIVGLIIAFWFYRVVRDTPDQHPKCNQAERQLINDDASQLLKSIEPTNPVFPWQAMLCSLSLWGNCITQFLTNVGWFFVVSYLPQYLEEVHHVALVKQGVMTAFPSGIGILGSLVGGRCTDWAIRRIGLKWGRRLPIAASRFVAAGGFGICLLLDSTGQSSIDVWLPWVAILGLSIAAAATDFGSPAIWAYAQDVGGKYTASILGWGNMWGNLGAACAPLIYIWCLGETPTITEWNSVFAICCGVFILAGLSAMLVDATKQLTVERPTVD